MWWIEGKVEEEAMCRWQEERRWGQSKGTVVVVGGGTVCEKKCRVEGLGRAESALMQTLRGACHTHCHTHTLPVHSHLRSSAATLLWIPSISGCHTGQSWLLEHRLPVALGGYYMVYRSSTNNMDRIRHFPLPLQIITYHKSWGILPPTHARDLSQP